MFAVGGVVAFRQTQLAAFKRGIDRLGGKPISGRGERYFDAVLQRRSPRRDAVGQRLAGARRLVRQLFARLAYAGSVDGITVYPQALIDYGFGRRTSPVFRHTGTAHPFDYAGNSGGTGRQRRRPGRHDGLCRAGRCSGSTPTGRKQLCAALPFVLAVGRIHFIVER